MINTRTALPWAVTAILAACTIWLGQAYFVARTENRVLNDRQELAELALRTSDAQLAAERIVSRRLMARAATGSKPGGDIEQFEIATLRPKATGFEHASAIVVWIPGQRDGVCVGANLPGIDAEFSIWLISEQPVRVGEFRAGVDGVARTRIALPSPRVSRFQFAISRGSDPSAWVLVSD